MIISASRRTDIPAFFSDWFANRMHEGYCCVRNPFNAHQVSRINLDRSVVDCIVFWTKNPTPMLDKLDVVDAYPYYFQYTITGYGHDVEPRLPEKKDILIPTFIELSDRLGSKRVIWRYDPIFFTEKYTPDYHVHAFSEIARMLDGKTDKCVISFVDVYRRNKKALNELGAQGNVEADNPGLLEFASRLSGIADEHGMELATCAEGIDLSQVGISHNACIDRLLIEDLVGAPMGVGKDKSQRPECFCVASVDIGPYNTCGHGCRYCYANYSPSVVERNLASYDPESPLLCGQLNTDDKVTERAMRSLVTGTGDSGQLSLGSLF